MIHNINKRTIQFKNCKIGYRIIERLLELERKNPKYFDYAVDWIQKMYKEVNTQIGKSTAMVNPYKPDYSKNNNVLNLCNFIELRFKHPEKGRQIVITLIEIEAREIDIDSLYGILAGIEFAYADIFSKKEFPKNTAKILPFPE